MLPPLLVLLAWPAVAAALFANLRAPLAVLVTILAGFLLLPELTEIDLPLLPPIDKRSLPVLSALALALLLAPRPGEGAVRPGVLPASPVARLLLATLVAGAFATVLTNGDPLYYGPVVLPGLRPWDALSAIAALALSVLPALLARKYLAGPDGHRLILTVLCVAALCYSLLALVEIRLSPQMNNWFYGFFPHSWVQHVRAGGFRPLVFLSHGLVLAMVFCMAILAAAGLSRADAPRRTLWLLAAGWLLMTLVLSRSLGALVIAVALAPVVLFVSVRLQLMAAAAIAVLFVTYPILRGADLVPLEAIVSTADGIDPQRAGSLQYRIDNEEILLARALERPAFGWGAWGRSRVYDPETGRDISVTDGYWVIAIGSGGWVGYVGEFGLLAFPIFPLLWRVRRLEIGRETAILALLLAANLVDLLPNAGLTPLTWILAGALWGRLEHVPEVAAEAQADAAARDSPAARAGRRGHARPHPVPAGPARPASAYTRQSARIVRAGPSVRR